MFFTGISSVFKLPKADTIEPSAEDEEKFVTCVLEGKPFTKTVTVGNYVVTFTTPSANEYKILGTIEDDIFADYLFVSNVQTIRRGENVLYIKDENSNFEDRLNKLSSIFKDAVVFPIIVGLWYEFRIKYNKLYEKAISADFFGQRKNT